MIRQILVPVDFSEHSMNALSYGQVLFEKNEVTFHLFATFQLNAPGVIEDEWGNEWLESWESADMETYIPVDELEKLLKEVKQNNKNEKHQFKMVYTVNTLEDGVAEQVAKLGIDLILMGTKGAKGLKQFFLGSNAVILINKVRSCPIIVVPSAYTTKTGPKQVVFSTNFKRQFNTRELQPLMDLLTQWNAKLKIVQLMEDEYLDYRQKIHRDALVVLLKKIPHVFNKIMFDSSETEAIRDFVMETQSDMISLIYHKQSFLYGLLQENVVEKTAFNSPVPLLVLRGV